MIVVARRPVVGFLLEALTPAAILFLLAVWYGLRFEHLGTVWDIWFGADIPRLIRWVNDPGFVDRWHLHPLAVPPLKAYGWVLDTLHVPRSPRLLFVYSLPLIVTVAVCITASARILAGLREVVPSFVIGLGLAAFSSMLAFGPIPECHAAGGAFLLLQASLVLQWLASRSPDAEPALHLRKWILVTGVAAAGFTLSNLMPAAILASPTLLGARSKVWIPALMCLVLVLALAVPIANGREVSMPDRIQEWIDYEMDWTYMPTLNTLWYSFTGLVTYQFGVPEVELTTWENPFDGTTVRSIIPRRPGSLHHLALLAWLAGIGVWWWTRSGTAHERQFVVLSAAAAASLIGFHSIYGSYESYVVSPHAWPYIALPGVIAGLAAYRQKHRLPMALIIAAMVMSCVQSARGFRSLDSLPVQPGHVAIAATSARSAMIR